MDSISVKTEKPITFKKLMQRELLMASAIPASALLLAGAIGSQQVDNGHLAPFLLMILLCAMLVFWGERALLLKMQGALLAKLSTIAQICQESLDGDTTRRVWLESDDEYAALGSTINTLLDHYTALQSEQEARKEAEISAFNQQLQQMASQLKPVLDGDLRTSLTVPDGPMGAAAHTINTLIETLVQFTRWTLYTSRKAMNNAQQVAQYSVELAQAANAQLQRLAQVSETLEKLKLLSQRVSETLQITTQLAQEIHVSLEQKAIPVAEGERYISAESDLGIYRNTSTRVYEHNFSTTTDAGQSSIQPYASSEKILNNVRRQAQLLEITSYSTREVTPLAESAIEGIYQIARNLQQFSIDVLKSAEYAHAIGVLAEDWHGAAQELSLPEEVP